MGLVESLRQPAARAARAGRRALPAAAAIGPGEPAAALGRRLAVTQAYGYAAAGIDASRNHDAALAPVGDAAARHDEPIAVAAVARARVGDDHHTPAPVEARLSRSGRT